MSSAAEFQKLVYDTLMADGAIRAIAQKVYDNVPDNPYGTKTAYISFGPYDANQDDADCIDGIEATLQVDIWSKTPGVVEVKTLTDLVRKALHEKSLTLTENALVDTRVEIWRIIPNPGGEHHGVVQVTALIEEPS